MSARIRVTFSSEPGCRTSQVRISAGWPGTPDSMVRRAGRPSTTSVQPASSVGSERSGSGQPSGPVPRLRCPWRTTTRMAFGGNAAARTQARPASGVGSGTWISFEPTGMPVGSGPPGLAQVPSGTVAMTRLAISLLRPASVPVPGNSWPAPSSTQPSGTATGRHSGPYGSRTTGP